MGFLWIILSLVLIPLRPGVCVQVPEAGVTRPNYGVDFNYLFAINNMHGTWKHVWTIDLSLLSRNIDLPVDLRCTGIESLCKPAREFLREVVVGMANATAWVQKQFVWARDPDMLATINRSGDRRRKKRGLLPFVGEIEKILFGIATERDVNSLKATLEDLTKLHETTVHQVTNLGDNLASVTKLVHDQAVNTETGFKHIKTTFENLTQQVNKRFSDLTHEILQEQTMTRETELGLTHTWIMMKEVFPRLIDVIKVLTADSQLLAGIQTILQGYIPITLIPPQDLVSGLKVAEQGIKNRFPAATLSYSADSIGYYYTHKIVMPVLESNRISLIVDIPVDLQQEVLYVYAIRTFPVALLPYNPYTHSVDPTSKAGYAQSRLFIEKTHFLISDKGDHWSTASDLELASCTGQNIRYCKNQFPLFAFQNVHCIERIWKNAEFGEILEVCPYRLTHIGSPRSEARHVQVIPLSKGRWYIEGPLDSKWTITCPSRSPEVRSACTSCVIQVDCGCGIEGKYFRIPTRVSTCDSVFSPLHRNFSVNPFSYTTRAQPWVVNLTGDSEMHAPPHIKPDIVLPDGGTWDDVLESMDEKRLDLNKLYKKQVNESRLFKSEAEALLLKIRSQDKLLSALSSWPDWILGLVVTLTFINSGIIVLACFCFFSRVHAAPIMEELDLIEHLEYEMIGIEAIILVICCLNLLLLIILAWPVLSNWLRNTRLMKRIQHVQVRVKAVGYRPLRAHKKIKLVGTFTFEQPQNQITRHIVAECILGSIPVGTCLGHQIPTDMRGTVTLSDNNYRITLRPAIVLVLPSEETKECQDFALPHDYAHRKFSVPRSSHLNGVMGIRVWIE